MDVVGYSRLMAVDEEGVLAAVNELRKEVIDPAVSRFQGRTVKLMGDGTLMEFESAVDAVKFGLDVQHAVHSHNHNIDVNKRIEFRIGINIGDVIVEDDDIHGNGVNVASRLEGLAETGGICVSGTVVDHVKGNVDVSFTDCGKQHVKNIPEALHVFGISASDIADKLDGSTSGPVSKNQVGAGISPGVVDTKFTDIDLSLPDSPSIAVLPFNNMSADPEQEFFSDGITEDIITALSKIAGLLVVARNSTFTYKGKAVDIRQVSREQGVRYVLEGSVRKAGNRVRINAQLIDATTGHHLWAERYDRLLEDIFAVQDEITKEVTIALDVRLSGGEQTLMWSSGTESLEAWELARQAMDYINRNTSDLSDQPLVWCQRALELDPEYAWAWVAMGYGYHLRVDAEARLNPGKIEDAELRLALDCGQKALALDSSCTDAYALLSICYLTKGDYDQAIAMSVKAVKLAPSHAENLAVSAIVHNKFGQPEKALELVKKAMRYCPIYPLWYLWVLGMAYRYTDQTDAAISTFETAISRGLSFVSVHVSLASTYGELDRLEEAKKPVSEILRQNPDFSIERYMAGLSYKNPSDMERFEDGLRKVGLPD